MAAYGWVEEGRTPLALAVEVRSSARSRDVRLERLLQSSAGGDRAAFADLYAETATRLFGVALRIVGRPDHAEDVLQEAFVRIWHRAGDYRPERGSPLAWLCTIVRNKAIDRRRRERPEVELDEERAAEESPDTSLLSEDARQLQACLEALGEPQRGCVVMAFVEGYTHQELAARLDRPLGTIKSWIRRSLGQLKLCLET